MLRLGDKNQAVADLQSALAAQGYPLTVDGHFGRATQAAVTAYQRDNDLVADGIAGVQTLAALLGGREDTMLRQSDINDAANLLGVEPAVIHAINQVEANGRGFLPDGRVKILFERHIFYRELVKKIGRAAADRWAQEAPHICSKTPGGYRGGVAEYPRFSRAFTIDPDAAMKACSWGAYQIMGFNHAAAGFESVGQFVDAMKHSEGEQLKAVVRFIAAHPAMLEALKNKKWADFARRYNGPDYKSNDYDTKLAAAYRKFA